MYLEAEGACLHLLRMPRHFASALIHTQFLYFAIARASSSVRAGHSSFGRCCAQGSGERRGFALLVPYAAVVHAMLLQISSMHPAVQRKVLVVLPCVSDNCEAPLRCPIYLFILQIAAAAAVAAASRIRFKPGIFGAACTPQTSRLQD